MMITRKDYMSKKATHSEYYREVINASGFKLNFPDKAMQVYKEELANGNKHLNPCDGMSNNNRIYTRLSYWDNMAELHWFDGVSNELKKRGTYLTSANMVCVLKEAVRMELERNGLID
jgi:hypothetical protein